MTVTASVYRLRPQSGGRIRKLLVEDHRSLEIEPHAGSRPTWQSLSPAISH